MKFIDLCVELEGFGEVKYPYNHIPLKVQDISITPESSFMPPSKQSSPYPEAATAVGSFPIDEWACCKISYK